MRFAPGPKFFVFILILLLAASLSSHAQTSQGTLRGQVTDPSGAAVANANVLVTPSAGAVLTVTTNRDGIYEIKNLASGKYAIKVTALGFTAFESSAIEILPGQIQ